jgi:hypothetical protein
VIAAVIPDAMLLPTDECFAQEVPDHVYDDLTCPKYALCDSNPGSWLTKEQKSRRGGSVMVWGCISHDCKLDLVTIQGNLTGDQYIRDVLQPVVVPHFDNHPLATRPVYMDDNARPHRSRAVTAYLQSEAVTSVPWPAMSPDLNPIEHIWDMLGHRIQAREPPVQNIPIYTGLAASGWLSKWGTTTGCKASLMY